MAILLLHLLIRETYFDITTIICRFSPLYHKPSNLKWKDLHYVNVMSSIFIKWISKYFWIFQFRRNFCSFLEELILMNAEDLLAETLGVEWFGLHIESLWLFGSLPDIFKYKCTREIPKHFLRYENSIKNSQIC